MANGYDLVCSHFHGGRGTNRQFRLKQEMINGIFQADISDFIQSSVHHSRPYVVVLQVEH